jgi:hypothetical protein
MRIQLEGKEIRFLYALVIALDAIFLFFNTPWMSLPFVPLGQSPQMTSLLDFVRYQLDLKYEQNVATWYSSILLLAAGVMAVLNCRYSQVPSKFKWMHRAGWSFMAFVLIALSADETATVHEKLARLLNAMNGGNGGPQYTVGAGDWIPILLPPIVIAAVGMTVFFSYLFKSYRNTLLLAFGGVIFWVGAIFAESIEAGTTHLNLSRLTEGFVEEGCEIVGTTCLLFAFTEFFQQRQPAAESLPPPKTKSKHRRDR